MLHMLKNDLMYNCLGAYVLRCQTDVDKVVLNNVRKQLVKWQIVQHLSQHCQTIF